jgi:plastocyanin
MAALAGALSAADFLLSARDNATAAPVDWSRAQRVDVKMVEYEFVPDHLRFHRGVAYQLTLINAGREGHDFTAPDFLAAVHVRNPEALNATGTSVFLHPGEEIHIYFISYDAGLFAPRCADHDWAGMTATIVID